MTEKLKQALLVASGDRGTATQVYNALRSGAIAAEMHDKNVELFSEEVVDLLQTLAGMAQAKQLIIRFASNTKRGNNLGDVGAQHALNALDYLNK